MAADRPPGPREEAFGLPVAAIVAAALLGAILLLVAEFTTLYSIHLSTYGSHARRITTGSHNGYALVPVGLLAAALAAGPVRARSRAACLALLATGLIGLGIALIGDLPDTDAHGLTAGLALASSTAGPGLYIETLGAILAVLAGGMATLATWPARPV